MNTHTGLPLILKAGGLVLAVSLLAGCQRQTQPGSVETITPYPALPTTVALPDTQGFLVFPYLVADAGNFSLQAGEEIPIRWESAPAGASSYEIQLIHDDGTAETILQLVPIHSSGVSGLWLVPERQSGRLEGVAHYADGQVVRSNCCSSIFTGSRPPEGICSLKAYGIAPPNIYAAPDSASMRIAGLAPGVYLEVVGRTEGDWYHVRLESPGVAEPPQDERVTGWVHAGEGVGFYGPCTSIPYQYGSADEQAHMDSAPGWLEVQDPVSGIRFALPCFWFFDFPDEGARALSGAGTLRNYAYAPVTRSHDQDLFESGAIKIDLVFSQRGMPGDTPLERMQAYLNNMTSSESEGTTRSIETLDLNGQAALQVRYDGIFGPGGYYLFELADGSFLIFAPNPQALDHADVQAILASLALTAATEVGTPLVKPAPPPFEGQAECMMTDPV